MNRQEFLEILKESKYLRYVDVLQKLNRPLSQSLEKHHIYPRSFEEGKIDAEDNIVWVTRGEHLKAHILLVLSLEQVGRLGLSYQKALKAVNIIYLTDWKNLTDEDKETLADFVETLPQLSSEVLHSPKSLETRRKMSEANRRRVVAPMQGKKQSLKTRELISKALKGRVITEEHRRRIREAKIGTHHAPHSETTKHKMSETAKSRITVWKDGIKTYCRTNTLQEFLEKGYFLTKRESL